MSEKRNRDSGVRETSRDESAQKKTDAAPETAVPAIEREAAEVPEDLPAAHRQALEEKRELYDRLLRKQAELENFRKRVEREKEDFVEHATANVLRALLPVLDAFERALKHREAGVPEKFFEGMELIHRQLLDVVARAGATPVEAQGKLFDPHLHQAVETITSAEHRDHEVVEELQRGYRLKHRLLRPAIVKVAVRPPELAPADKRKGGEEH